MSYLQTYAITEKMRAKVLLLMQSESLEILEKVSCLAFFSGDACLSLKFGNQISLVDSIKVGISVLYVTMLHAK